MVHIVEFLKAAGAMGAREACRKHRVAPATYFRWRRRYASAWGTVPGSAQELVAAVTRRLDDLRFAVLTGCCRPPETDTLVWLARWLEQGAPGQVRLEARQRRPAILVRNPLIEHAVEIEVERADQGCFRVLLRP